MNMKNTRSITVWMLILITIGAVDNIRNLPTTALFGGKIISFYLLASILFLIPCALVSASLSAQFPEESGIYSWVKQAFGQRWGFVAVWLQWVENAPFFPAIVSFIAATIGYLISPTLANNKTYLLIFVLSVFWLLTLVNILGIRLSAWFSSLCTITGLIIPMALLISMGLIWYLTGQPLAMHLTLSNMTPHFNHLSNWVTMQGVLLSLCGIELATVHAKDTRNPRRNFPIALLVSVVIITITLIAGALSIAFVIPVKSLSLVSGIMDTFNHFLNAYHMHWLLPILAVMVAVGSLGGVNSWIIGPTRGLRVACEESNFRPWLIKKNRHNAPVSLLLLQAVLVSVVVALFFLLPGVNATYWLLSVLAAQIYMMMYILMFAASIVIRLRSNPNKGSYQIPGGLFGHLLVSGCGLIGSILAFLICFLPPSNIHIGNLKEYELLMIGGLFILCFLPLLFIKRKNSIS
jgi:glutamate:GABA antiporter